MQKNNGVPQTVIIVSDEGAGVPNEAVANIFQPFFCVDETRDRESGGTRLELTITERTVKLQNGTIRAVNAPDNGFIVEIRRRLFESYLTACYFSTQINTQLS